MIKVAIVGSREYPHLFQVFNYMKKLPKDVTIISGGALGVDLTAEKAADMLGMKKEIYKPDYKKHGDKLAPLKRNTTIVEACDMLVAFWDGESNGTLDAIRKATKLNKKVTIIGVVPPKKERITVSIALQTYTKWKCLNSKFETADTIDILSTRYQTSDIVIEEKENGRIAMFFHDSRDPDIILVPPDCEICKKNKAVNILHKQAKVLQACQDCIQKEKIA